jgi:uncharacterized protein YydD (DUF2326 family)
MYGHGYGHRFGERGDGCHGRYRSEHVGPCWQHYHEISAEDRKEYLADQKKYLEAELKEVQDELERLEKTKND